MLSSDQLHEVPEAAKDAWKEALKLWGQWHKFFLQGFRLAADGIYTDWPLLTKRKDQKEVFDRVRDAAYNIMVENGSMKDGTFDRYCKIARYCLIFRVPWEIGQEANRAQLRWCRERAKTYRGGSQEERMIRAWEEMPPDLKGKKEKDEDEGSSQLLPWPDPSNFSTEDEFLAAATKIFVGRLQKEHADALKGESGIKASLRRFIGDVTPYITEKKGKKEAAKKEVPASK